MIPRFLAIGATALALVAPAAMAADEHDHQHGQDPAQQQPQAMESCGCKVSLEEQQAYGAPTMSSDGFEFVGGETGWRVGQHKYELQDGLVAHAADCPVAVAAAMAGEPG